MKSLSAFIILTVLCPYLAFAQTPSKPKACYGPDGHTVLTIESGFLGLHQIDKNITIYNGLTSLDNGTSFMMIFNSKDNYLKLSAIFSAPTNDWEGFLVVGHESTEAKVLRCK